MRYVVIFLGVLAAASLSTAVACTGIQLTAKDKGVVTGRTLEFGLDLKSEILVIPKGTELVGSLPDGGSGIRYMTKYGIIGANAFGLPIILDGMNDQGLYIGGFYFPGFAGYSKIDKKNESRAMAPHEFGNWVLGNFASIEEVKSAVKNVVLGQVMVEQLKAPAPIHFLIKDKTGKSIVIEPIGGTLQVHDNPFGVLTNAPTFDWHLTNLRNYINLTNMNVAPVRIAGVELSSFGQGSGMFGIPGDFTPPSRFVRAVFYSTTATPSTSAELSVYQAFHILNLFDIPLGSIKAGKDGVEDSTEWTSVSDLKNLKYYFKTYNNQAIQMVDLHEALKRADGKVTQFPMGDNVQAVINILAPSQGQ